MAIVRSRTHVDNAGRTIGMPKEELRRGYGLSTATYVVIASMVGAGILASPGYMMVSLLCLGQGEKAGGNEYPTKENRPPGTSPKWAIR